MSKAGWFVCWCCLVVTTGSAVLGEYAPASKYIIKSLRLAYLTKIIWREITVFLIGGLVSLNSPPNDRQLTPGPHMYFSNFDIP